MKTVFFTLVQDSYQREVLEYELFESSFKKFHPDIDLVRLGTKEIEDIKRTNPWANLYNMKATAAKLFCDEYDLVVNIDADHFIFDRMDEILEGNYDIACPSNYNTYENVSLSVSHRDREQEQAPYDIVSEKHFLQGGLVASPSKDFWNAYEYASMRHSMSLLCKENSVLNLLVEFYPFKFKLLDGDYDIDSVKRTCFYGCSSLNLEREVVIENDTPMLKGKPVKAYHVAKGAGKPRFKQIFNEDVTQWFYNKIGINE